MELRADFLIIGSGIAGLRAAAELGDAGHVLVLTKAGPREATPATRRAASPPRSVADDSPALHAADTMAPATACATTRRSQVLVEDGPRYVAS